MTKEWILQPQAFQKRLLAWFDHHGRKNLPWQLNPTPYRVWLSEIMLQQTQVATVIDYFERFTRQFPSVVELANASEEAVLSLWSGLGYYARARNLHQCAVLIQERHHGQFPSTLAELMALPGIGRSTAAAIRSLAFQLPAAILDGNVKRIFARLEALEHPVNQTNTVNILWEKATLLAPEHHCAEYTQALMDLGALICRPRHPQCTQCPLKSGCRAFQLQQPEAYPVKKSRQSKPTRESALLIIEHETSLLLEKRPKNGIWGGLWSFPIVPLEQLHKGLDTHLLTHYGVHASIKAIDTPFRHTLTHFHWQLTPAYLQKVAEADESTPAMTAHLKWLQPDEAKELGLAKPISSILSTYSGNTAMKSASQL